MGEARDALTNQIGDGDSITLVPSMGEHFRDFAERILAFAKELAKNEDLGYAGVVVNVGTRVKVTIWSDESLAMAFQRYDEAAGNPTPPPPKRKEGDDMAAFFKGKKK